MKKITLENFSEDNRSKVIGDSLYRIARSAGETKWHVYEIYNNGPVFAHSRSERFTELQEAIDYFNGIDKERYLTSI